MSVTRYRQHAVECPDCGHISRAETLFVARKKDQEHRTTCEKEQAEAETTAAAKAAQGDLFGGS